ncbi:MAG TPA: RDD family protein, partial [Mycobacterium sp.]|uniref:RDD family protein n=1 Tax=Mycobacterium sp. TaxID=1785 RepID=UPI002F40F917
FIGNYGYRQGRTGSSIGKSVLGFQVISEKTGQPIGFSRSLLRQIAHILDAAVFFIGYLLPLFDAKRQTFADKIMTTICVPISCQPDFSPAQPRTR